MAEEEKTTPDKEDDKPAVDNQAPADALSRTPDELEAEEAERAAANPDAKKDDESAKKDSAIRRLFRRLNIYFLIFLLLLVIAIVVVVVNYLNSQKVTPEPNIATQKLSEDALKQLANTDASVGGTSQTLTIQGNAVIAGQTLMRGNANIAGNLQTGGSIQGPSLTISGASNLNTAQINSLQVAQNVAIQGTTTMRDLNVSGTSSFSGTLTAAQITVTKLVLSGAGELQIPNHLTFTGTTPGRTVGSAMGPGGSVSINGSDTAGTINVNTGNSPSAGCFIQVTFAKNYPTTPRVIVSPVGRAAGQTEYYVTRTATGFSLCTANTPSANQAFAYDFFVTG